MPFCQRSSMGTRSREPYPVTNEEGEFEEWMSGSEKFNTADIVVTTFSQARLLRLRHQRLSKDWTVWFDHPDVSDLVDIEPYEPERWGEIPEEEQRAAGIATRKATG